MFDPTKSLSFEFEIKNLTYIVLEVWSSYSTSASANAVFSTTDQSTGLHPYIDFHQLKFS